MTDARGTRTATLLLLAASALVETEARCTHAHAMYSPESGGLMSKALEKLRPTANERLNELLPWSARRVAPHGWLPGGLTLRKSWLLTSLPPETVNW